MSATTADAQPSVTAAASVDERLAHRGIFQRLFIRPEIGAMIGVVGIWVFFWAVAVQFGTSNSTAGIIDVASTLGIMGVAVSMLMIGGEFDLSSGAMTGAMGILVIMLSKEVGDLGGAGLSLFIAIPISLVVALGIGLLNGYLVERTKLPSFTITLATYYVLIGSKLGFSKLIVEKVEVGNIQDASGYDAWFKVFGAEWVRNSHQFDRRDNVYLVGVLAAIALIVTAMLIMQFQRRKAGANSVGLPVMLAGLALVVGGIVALHQTDSIGGNFLGAALIGAGSIIAAFGLATWQFQPLESAGNVLLTPAVLKFTGIGLVLLLIGVGFAKFMDSEDDSGLFFPFTVQGFRATMFLLFMIGGYVCLAVAVSNARRSSAATRTVVSIIISATFVALAWFIRTESVSVKFRSEAFSVLHGIALLILLWALLGARFTERNAVDRTADSVGTKLLALAGALGAIGFGFKLLFVTQADLDAEIANAKFSMRTVWFIGFAVVMIVVLAKTRFGSWTFAVGGNKDAARQVGVPAARTKTQLFMLVSGAAWLVGMLLAFRLNAVQANTGNGEEFDYIIAAVVGGTLLTGGYGTALGGVLGALIVAMSGLGITSSRWNSDWRFLFLGVILFTAMLANRSIRTRAEGMRR